MMSDYDRIAQASGFKTLNELLEKAKTERVTLVIPGFYRPKYLPADVMIYNFFKSISGNNYKLFYDLDTDQIQVGMNEVTIPQ